MFFWRRQPNHRKATTASDRDFVVGVIVIALAIAIFPIAFGWKLTPPGYSYTGGTAVNPGDQFVYYQYIEQGRTGGLMMQDRLTSEDHPTTLFQPIWWALGRTAELFQWSTPFVYLLARWAFIPILILTLWWAVRRLFQTAFEQRIALVLSLFASGLGGIWAWIYRSFELGSSPDLWVSEAIPILNFLTTPHFLLITSGIIFVLVGVEWAWRTKDTRLHWRVALTALAVLSIHPFHVVTWVLLWMGMTVWYGWHERRWPGSYVRTWLLVLLVGSPALLFYGLQLWFDPLVAARAAQNINLTWYWPKTFLIIGTLLPPIILGLVRHRHSPLFPWIFGWACVYLVAIYAPVLFQRRLSQGMFIAFAWLAVPGIVIVWQQLKKYTRTVRLITIILAGLWFSNSWLTVHAIVLTVFQRAAKSDSNHRLYLSPEYQSLLQTIRDRRAPHQVLLSNPLDGLTIAGLTGQRVWNAHSVETVAAEQKIQYAADFFANSNPAWQKDFLDQARICLILLKADEHTAEGWQPEDWPDITKIWSGSERQLYQRNTCGDVPAGIVPTTVSTTR